jgi:exodeoxyribonuclease VII small subunit
MSQKKPLKEQLTELEELVSWFEQDDLDIEEAIQKFEIGSELAGSIKKDLGELENKITVLKKSFEEEQ